MVKKIWIHLEELILVPSFIATVAIVFMQVVMRYLFNSSLSWSEELTRYIFVWQIWLGISYTAKKENHLRVTTLTDRISEKGKQYIEVIVMAIWIGFFIYMSGLGYQLTMKVAGFGQKSAALRIPMAFCYLAIPVGCTLTVVRLIELCIRNYRRGKKGEGTV